MSIYSVSDFKETYLCGPSGVRSVCYVNRFFNCKERGYSVVRVGRTHPLTQQV